MGEVAARHDPIHRLWFQPFGVEVSIIVYGLLHRHEEDLPAMPDDFSELSEQQLVQALHNTPIATPASAKAGAAIGELMRRLGGHVLDLKAAIDRLDQSSTRLVSETNRLTTRILWLTIIGVVLAIVGVGIAVVQLLRG
jgi:hypothetical protein